MSTDNGTGFRAKLERLQQIHTQIAMAIALALRAVDTDDEKPKAAPKAPPAGGKLQARRQVTAAILARYDTTKPTPSTGHGRAGIGTLVRHGYLKHKGKGLIRTAKPFTP